VREIDSSLPRNSGPKSWRTLRGAVRRGGGIRFRGRIVEARDTKPVYRAGMIYTLADLGPWPRCTRRHLPLRLSLSSSLSMVPRARLNNINYARSERGYTRLPHRPLRCPPVSNATINYPTVAATALARLSISFSFSHIFFLRPLSLSLFIPPRNLSAAAPAPPISVNARESQPRGRERVFYGLLTRGSQRSYLGYFCTALELPAAALTYHYRHGGMTLRDIALALRARCASCIGQVLIRAFSNRPPC